jgi:hypothetical protein
MSQSGFIQADIDIGVGAPSATDDWQADLNIGVGQATQAAHIGSDVDVLLPGRTASVQADVWVPEPVAPVVLQSVPHAFLQMDVNPQVLPGPAFIQADVYAFRPSGPASEAFLQADVNAQPIYSGGSGNMPVGPGFTSQQP